MQSIWLSQVSPSCPSIFLIFTGPSENSEEKYILDSQTDSFFIKKILTNYMLQIDKALYK